MLGIWQPLEHLAYRGLFRLRGAMPWDQRVVLIDIDDAFFKGTRSLSLASQAIHPVAESTVRSSSPVWWYWTC
ncbi:hypothetical protein [Coleofasciculus sp. H7-2]|uniref:hypothetical protein n=1 Tax=Coleofasciculus sp. H7-2 TaxID=3351545 RepID=UPI00367024CB